MACGFAECERHALRSTFGIASDAGEGVRCSSALLAVAGDEGDVVGIVLLELGVAAAGAGALLIRRVGPGKRRRLCRANILAGARRSMRRWDRHERGREHGNTEQNPGRRHQSLRKNKIMIDQL